MVVCGRVLLICTTPVVTLVVVLVLAPAIVVNPGEEVMGVKLKAPETNPFRLIFPVPAFSVVSLPRITPVLESPKIMLEFVAAIVPWTVIEIGEVTTTPPAKVVLSDIVLFKVTDPVLRKSTFKAKVLPLPFMDTE